MPSPARKEILALEVRLGIKAPQLCITLNRQTLLLQFRLPACMPAQQLMILWVKYFIRCLPGCFLDSLAIALSIASSKPPRPHASYAPELRP